MSERIVYQRESFSLKTGELFAAPGLNYCPVRPVKKSQGEFPNMFDKMADTMLELYAQEEKLINSVSEMLTRMAKNFDNADETSGRF